MNRVRISGNNLQDSGKLLLSKCSVFCIKSNFDNCQLTVLNYNLFEFNMSFYNCIQLILLKKNFCLLVTLDIYFSGRSERFFYPYYNFFFNV